MTMEAQDAVRASKGAAAGRRGDPAPDRKSRRFVGASLREVFDQVREEMGADALILEQRTVEGRVEVLASVESPHTLQLQQREGVAAALRELGFGNRLLARLPPVGRGWAGIESALASLVPAAPPPEPLCGRIRLVGPPGAGKTTALIKLMASRVLRYGNLGTLMIGTDRSRLSGSEPLAASAELLGVEYVECAEHELPEMIARWRHMQLILIDAAGPRGGQPPPALPGVQDLLTVPSVWQSSALRRMRGGYADHPLAGVVLTHTDQAETFGECANLLVEWQLPVWWIGSGADLACELEPANAHAIGRCLLGRFDRSALTAMFQG